MTKREMWAVVTTGEPNVIAVLRKMQLQYEELHWWTRSPLWIPAL